MPPSYTKPDAPDEAANVARTLPLFARPMKESSKLPKWARFERVMELQLELWWQEHLLLLLIGPITVAAGAVGGAMAGATAAFGARAGAACK